jgi:hypothetical protein
MDVNAVLKKFLETNNLQVSEELVGLALAEAAKVVSLNRKTVADLRDADAARVFAASLVGSGTVTGGAYAMRKKSSDPDDKFLA